MAVLLAGCGQERDDYAAAYVHALKQYPGAPVKPVWVKHFVQTYGDFTGKNLGKRIHQLYADNIYFNDSIRTCHTNNDLATYLEKTADNIQSMEITVLDWQVTGRDAYLRWTMRTRFHVAFHDVDNTTLGMTHLRFNDQGKVILHQDFWDSTRGIFEHIPVVGGMIHQVRKRL